MTKCRQCSVWKLMTTARKSNSLLVILNSYFVNAFVTLCMPFFPRKFYSFRLLKDECLCELHLIVQILIFNTNGAIMIERGQGLVYNYHESWRDRYVYVVARRHLFLCPLWCHSNGCVLDKVDPSVIQLNICTNFQTNECLLPSVNHHTLS